MAKYTRVNAWQQGGTFANTDLLWYAKGVGVMQSRALNDPNSWWFFAAIHGEYISNGQSPDWSTLPHPPDTPVTPPAAPNVSAQFWDQCQHQSWYFIPWHRGYLLALEAQVRQAIMQMGGPATWALPYWNYLGPDDEYKIPPALNQKTLPDGSPNPLFVTARYGPLGDSNVFVVNQAIFENNPTDPHYSRGPVTNKCMSMLHYTGTDPRTDVGFGGLQTPFWHGGTYPSGELESNPHNLVHVYVGGFADNDTVEGLMSDPGTAGLDPVFYLHHANIDRLWAAWNQTNKNPQEFAWLNGPAQNGQNQFVMPMPGATTWTFTPGQMSSLDALDYTYDHLPTSPPRAARLTARLQLLDVASPIAEEKVSTPVAATSELVGASPAALTLGTTGAATSVQLDTDARKRLLNSFTLSVQSVIAAEQGASPASAIAPSSLPDRTFLNLENVRGSSDATVLSVYIDLPDDAAPTDHPELLAGTVGLFGLRNASRPDSKHGGQGLSFVLEVTDVVDRLHLGNIFSVGDLHIRVVPSRPLPASAQITIGRISLYRRAE